MTIINFKSLLVVLTFATQSCKTTDPIETKPFPIKNIAEHFPLANGATMSASQFLGLFLFTPEQQTLT